MNIQPKHMQPPLQPGLARPGQVEAEQPLRPTTDRELVQRQTTQPRPLQKTEGHERLLDHLSTPLHQTGAARKAQQALAAYRQVVDLEQRDYVSALLGIDYYA